MAEDQNKNTVDDTTKTTEYEDVCYICRRPESVAGKMIHIQDNICICNDCMQKTFDTMNTGGFNMGDIMNMNNGKMPNISMINLADFQGGIPQSQKIKKKKPKEKKRSEETQAEPLLKSSTQQQYKPLGKIDLDSLNKKPAQKKPATPETHKEPQAKTNAVSQKPATNSEAPQKASTEAKVDNQNKNQNTVGQNKEHKQEKKQEAAKTVVNNTASAPKKVDAAEKPAEAPKT